MELVKSNDQVVKKQQKIQRRVEFYGFPKPLKVLMDASFILYMHEKGIKKSDICSYLEQDVNLFTTSCVTAELTQENMDLSQYLIMSKDVLVVARCSHGDKGLSSGECIQDAIGAENSKCYFVATGSNYLRSMLKQVPSVPVIRFRGGMLRLQKPSKLQKMHAQQAKGRAPKRKSAASVSSEVPHKKRQRVNPAEPWHWIGNRFLSDEDNSDDDPARKKVNEMTEGQSNTVIVAGFTVISGFGAVKYELRERFRSCGEILRIFVVPDKMTGRPKEVAFITFADRESVYKALRQSGSIIGGSAITVLVEQGRSRGVAWKKVNEMTEGQSNTVVVSGFTVISGFGVVKNELRERFKSCGEILRIFVVPDKITGRPKDVAFITFADRESVFKALLQSGYIIGGSAITVDVGRSFVD